jgi:hypothetical protein
MEFITSFGAYILAALFGIAIGIVGRDWYGRAYPNKTAAIRALIKANGGAKVDDVLQDAVTSITTEFEKVRK